MDSSYIRKNPILSSILLFLVIYITIHLGHPNFLYNKDGSVRQFGVGSRNKTIFPAWLMAIILSILCYLFIIVYIS